jgi:hypothetical protein
MAIGIRRDRGGVMPGTMLHTAVVADSLVKGQAVKLDPSDGMLTVAAGVNSTTAAGAQYIVAGVGESGVTYDSAATTFDAAVVPLDDQLTYITTAYDEAGSDASFEPFEGTIGRLNAANEPVTGTAAGTVIIVDGTAGSNTDVRILKTLAAGTDSGVPATVEFQFI